MENAITLSSVARSLARAGGEPIVLRSGRSLHDHGLGLARRLHDVVNDSVILGLLRAHVVIAVRVLLDLLRRLARVPSEGVIECLAPAQDFPRRDRDVGRLAARAT